MVSHASMLAACRACEETLTDWCHLMFCFVVVNFANADGRTALHIAAVRDDAQMVMYLLEAGADASRRDRWGITPREEARRCGFEKLASVFASLNKS